VIPSALTRVVLAFVLIFGFFARAATYKIPLLDHQAWRQADTASIGRNFVRERFNLFYPQVDQRGGQDVGYVETGLELFPFLVALLWKVSGVHAEVGRLLSALLFLASCLMVWRFVRRRFGDETGLVAAFFYAFGFPLMLWTERAFMNESLLICLSIGALLSTQRYLSFGRRLDLIVVVLATTLIGAIKLPYLIIWAPIVGLFAEAERPREWRWELGLIALVNLFVAGLWYRHAHQLGATTGLSFGMTDKLFDPNVVFSTSFAWVMVTRLWKDILGPIGAFGAVAGLWFAAREHRWCEVFGVAGFLGYLILVAGGNYIHDYYQLAVIPIAPSLVGLGWVRLAHLRSEQAHDRWQVLVVALALAVCSTFIRSVSAHSWYEVSTADEELCRAVDVFSAPEDRVVLLGTTDPKLLFSMDRKGWVLPPSADAEVLRAAWTAGAKFAVVPRSLESPSVLGFLDEHGTNVFFTLDADLVRLR
jgi:hypothetical protein